MGADLEARIGLELYSVLHYTGSAKMMALLIEHGAHSEAVDIHGNTPLHVAETPDVVKLLIGAGIPVDALNYRHETPLFHAANSSVATALLAHGTSMAVISSDGLNPVAYAVIHNKLFLAEPLLKAGGCDPYQTTHDGRTLLELAGKNHDMRRLIQTAQMSWSMRSAMDRISFAANSRAAHPIAAAYRKTKPGFQI